MGSIIMAHQIRTVFKQRIYLQVDGELLGETPARFQVLPAALTVAI